eukprot:CAMPEP_0119150506 /NCGR_PEP_ID=MMETSP1310-20130426/44910_1 /TAXON_ID=464262 /ORGANISM="Genus nov. species nov., Strain RCC2339" /LENGTH=216 /DNA_ID=CAMNT_0007142707 /DNA_START=185 /DNA_END=835 /DNA_ORIENTATION=+
MHRTPHNAATYYKRYCGGERLYDIARDVDIAPTLLARIILECIHLDGEEELSVKELIRLQIGEPESIPDARLSEEVAECVAIDENYSPLSDRIRHGVGEEYERFLCECLHNLGISFSDETELRALGYPKTPDVKLALPIIVDECMVFWIESKASFGDLYMQSKNREQLMGYVNRFGPGLVVYWYGYVTPIHQEKDIVILDHFPRSAVVMHAQQPHE